MTGRLDRVQLTLRSVRHLHVRQVWARLRRTLGGRPSIRTPEAWWDPARAERVTSALGALGTVDTPSHVRSAVHAWRRGRVEVLGLSTPVPVTWRESFPSPLAAYHAHYHDALADATWVARQDDDGELRGAVGTSFAAWQEAWGAGGLPAWDPYPIAVRAMNWLRLIAWGGLDSADSQAHASLVRQLDLLARDLEWHLEGNHLLRDAWALAIVPACYRGPWADVTWRDGCRLFWEILYAQVDADGVHEERSPMYQARALRDALEVLAVHDALGVEVPTEGRARIARMGAALAWMRHADGTLRCINDAAGDHGVDLDRLLADTGRLTGTPVPSADGLSLSAASGFVSVAATVLGDRLLLDAASPSPAHQPGHAHAGALGFELDLGGRRVLVDSGCSGYDGDAWRPWFRGTAAHNTVRIDGLDQSELWATFRVARRARVTRPLVTSHGTSCEIRATCSPYHRPHATHERLIRIEGRDTVIEDSVTGALGRQVESFLHVDPAWVAEHTGDGTVTLSQGDAKVRVQVEEGPDFTLHHGERDTRFGWNARGFNDIIPAWMLRRSSTAYNGGVWRVRIVPLTG